MRPAMEGKRVPGEVEIHQNGLRYQSQLKSDNRTGRIILTLKFYEMMFLIRGFVFKCEALFLPTL